MASVSPVEQAAGMKRARLPRPRASATEPLHASIAPKAWRPSSSSALPSTPSTSRSSTAFAPIRARELPDRLRQARGFVGADAAEEIAHIQEDHAVIDARIARLEYLLRRATVLPDGPADDVATLGCTVEVEYQRTGRRASYRLNGIPSGADARAVSARSPVGRVLMGRRAGDVVSAELPAGGIESLRIVAITPPLAAEVA
jgi:transcription elongation factor GreA